MGKKKIQLGELEANLVNAVDSYVDLVNANKTKGTRNISRTGLIRSFFKELLSDKVLVKDFIELEHHYYFNKKELLENGTVKAVPEEPFSDNYFTVKKVPNNLDSFNAEFNSYCYGTNSNIHKGIYIYHDHGTKPSEFYANPVPLLFNYNVADNVIVISLIKFEDFTLFIKSEEDIETINSTIEYEKYFQDNFKYINEDGLEELNIELCFSEKELGVIEDFKGKKMIELLNKYDNDLFKNSLLDSDIKTDINLNNPIEDLINSNVAKDKELKEVNEKYVKPMKELKEKLEEIENSITWEDAMKEYK